MNRIWSLGGPEADSPRVFLDRGMRYGMSVFETIAIQRGDRFFFEEHLTRLALAARDLLEIEVPEINEFLDEARRIPRFEEDTGVLRIYITAGEGGLGDPCHLSRAFAIFEGADVLAGPGPGLRLMSSREVTPVVPGGWKTGNYWHNIRALRNARSAGFDEALLTGPDGSLIGGATGNLFCVINGQLLTPPVSSGARPGVVREWVLEAAGGMEGPLTYDDLLAADEIFLTNSRIGIASVLGWEGTTLPSQAFAKTLANEYRESVFCRE